MIPIVEERVGELQQFCIRYRVLRLDLFGSATTGNYHGSESDLDLLVEFQTLPSGEYANASRRSRSRTANRAGSSRRSSSKYEP